MHDLSHLGPKKVFIFGDGSFFITETVVWGVLVSQQAAAGSERQAGDCRIRGRKSVQHGTVCHGR